MYFLLNQEINSSYPFEASFTGSSMGVFEPAKKMPQMHNFTGTLEILSATYLCALLNYRTCTLLYVKSHPLDKSNRPTDPDSLLGQLAIRYGVAGPRLWNALPPHMRRISDINFLNGH